MKHPIQPLYEDESGVVRFHPNKIVQYMLDAGGRGERFDMNTIACLPNIPREDHEQFAQLIGCSHSGAGDLDCMSDEVWDAAYTMFYHKQTEEQARLTDLNMRLNEVRRIVKELAPVVFRIHPDDLQE